MRRQHAEQICSRHDGSSSWLIVNHEVGKTHRNARQQSPRRPLVLLSANPVFVRGTHGLWQSIHRPDASLNLRNRLFFSATASLRLRHRMPQSGITAIRSRRHARDKALQGWACRVPRCVPRFPEYGADFLMRRSAGELERPG
jgi:hypothetical protein